MAIIRPAAAHDLARIEEIYDAIHTAEEAGNVSIGWVRGVYPTRATAQAALDAGELFVLESDGTVYAAGRINSEQVPVYAEVPWAHDAAPEQVLVLHTLVVDPAAAGHVQRHRRRRARVPGKVAGQRTITARPHKENRRPRIALRGLRFLDLGSHGVGLPPHSRS